ncbi:MAG: hypothetical protein V3V00_16370 [Saprospiraceae bacterium]
MLINLSNHPSTKWSAPQKKAAQDQFGQVIDHAFPHIPPAWTMDEVVTKAKEILNEIKTKYHSDTAYVILIAGEQSFVVAMVDLCRQEEITCYNATSDRIVTENSDGSKNVKFEFIKFRKLI